MKTVLSNQSIRAGISLVLISLLASPGAIGQSLRIDRIERAPSGQVTIRYQTVSNAQYILLQGNTVTNINTPVITNSGVSGASAVLLAANSAQSFFRLQRVDGPPTITTFVSSPASGDTDVSVTRETILYFSNPLAADALLATNDFHAMASGRRLLTRSELSSDRRKATLFYLEPVPGSPRQFARHRHVRRLGHPRCQRQTGGCRRQRHGRRHRHHRLRHLEHHAGVGHSGHWPGVQIGTCSWAGRHDQYTESSARRRHHHGRWPGGDAARRDRCDGQLHAVSLPVGEILCAYRRANLAGEPVAQWRVLPGRGQGMGGHRGPDEQPGRRHRRDFPAADSPRHVAARERGDEHDHHLSPGRDCGQPGPGGSDRNGAGQLTLQ